MKNKFTWGDAVLISTKAPPQFHPGKWASICGFVQIISKKSAENFHCAVGDWIYTVEFEDGSDIEVAECFLTPYHSPTTQ